MTDSVLGALCSKMALASFIDEFVGGIWALELDDSVGQSYPAGLFLYPRTEFTWTTETARIEKARIEFFIYGQVASEVESLGRRSYQHLLVDELLPDFEGHVMQVYPTDFKVEATPARDQEAMRRFQAIVDLEIWLDVG